MTEEEYQNIRSWQIQTLANPPRIEWVVAGPGLLCILVGLGLLVAALLTWVSAPEDTTMDRLMIGMLMLGLGSYFFFGNLRECRSLSRRSDAERAAEVDELLRSGLITPNEHESIKRAIDQPKRR